MTWFEDLKKWNNLRKKAGLSYLIPKKGSKEYNEVKALSKKNLKVK